MLFKSIAIVATLVATALAQDSMNDTCQSYSNPIYKANATRSIITSITDENNFCTMLTGYGIYPVASNEACAGVYCQGTVLNGALPMPTGYIQSAHYVNNVTNDFVQITGCIDSTLWAQNPTDEGGQMDSHGWDYSCQGYSKFLSLLEPATNTFCIRCCNSSDNNTTQINDNCDTSHSTSGCWNLIPGLYTMADGSNCPLPAGAPNSTASPIISSGYVTNTAAASLPTSSGAASSPASTTAGGVVQGAQPSVKASASSAASAIVSTVSAIAASLVLAVMVAAL